MDTVCCNFGRRGTFWGKGVLFWGKGTFLGNGVLFGGNFESWNTFRTGTNIHYPGNRNLEEGYGQLLPLLDTQEPLRTLKDRASDYDIDPQLKKSTTFLKSITNIYFF